MSEEDDTPTEDGEPSMIGLLAGTVVWYEDLIAPIDEVWEADA